MIRRGVLLGALAGFAGTMLVGFLAQPAAAVPAPAAPAPADLLPPLPVPTIDLPPVQVTVPGLNIGVNVDPPPITLLPSSGTSSAPSAPAPAPAPGPAPAPAPASGSTGTTSAATPAAPADPTPTTATPSVSSVPASTSTPPAAPDHNSAPATNDHSSTGDQSVGSAAADVVTQPGTLASALTLALGLGVIAGAGAQAPRSRRRQRELLEHWTHASEQQRRVAEKLAEADRQKSEFLALVSHELRTPLTAVKGFVDTVLLHWERLADDRRRDLLTRASSNADELARLVGQLLDFARSDTVGVEVVPRRLEIREAIDPVLRDLAPVLAEHRVELEIPDEIAITADPGGFAHVLVNLLTNAVKFSPVGSRIVVRATRAPEGVVVSVSDQGSGIAPEDQVRVFDRFYQAADNQARTRRGTGIGLAIAQRFTELHGGRIWVDSEPGHGSAFSFTMPASREPAPSLVP